RPPPGAIADHIFLALVGPLITDAPEVLEAAEVITAAALALPRLAPALALYATSGRALIAVRQRDAETAAELHAALQPQSGSASFFVPLAFDRLLGLLAAACGRIDLALEHFAAGLAFCARAGYRPEYARIAADYADVLLEDDTIKA